MLYNQSFKLERVSFATEGIKDARETVIYCHLQPWICEKAGQYYCGFSPKDRASHLLFVIGRQCFTS
jgi:hypothetical protein